MFNEKKIPYLLMTEAQRVELMKQNSSIYFKGFMTEHLHLSDRSLKTMNEFVSKYGSVEPRSTLVVLQMIDECLGLEEKFFATEDSDAQLVLGSKIFEGLLKLTEEVKKLGEDELSLHEDYILEIANKVYEKC